jgi:hypothetical protein
MISFSPIEFAAGIAAQTTTGILFIESSNTGASLRYRQELRDLPEKLIATLARDQSAFVMDLTFDKAEEMMGPIHRNFDANSNLSFSAIFFHPNGKIAGQWFGGEIGAAMSKSQIAALRPS